LVGEVSDTPLGILDSLVGMVEPINGSVRKHPLMVSLILILSPQRCMTTWNQGVCC
jgi:hypothetical protein